MNKSLLYFPLISAGFVVPFCASSQSNSIDTVEDTYADYEPYNQIADISGSTKTLIADNAISWDKPPPNSTSSKANPEVTPQTRPNLSGDWVLNKDLSDNAAEKIKQTMQQARSSGRGGFERSGRSGGMKGRGRSKGMRGSDLSGGRGGKSGSRDTSFRTLQALFTVSENFAVAHEDPVFVILTNDGRKQRIYTDNRGASISVSGGMDQKVVTAGWEKDTLVVETTSDSGPKLLQYYKLNTDPVQLIVSTVIRHAELSDAISINRVYELTSVQPHSINQQPTD